MLRLYLKYNSLSGIVSQSIVITIIDYTLIHYLQYNVKLYFGGLVLYALGVYFLLLYKYVKRLENKNVGCENALACPDFVFFIYIFNTFKTELKGPNCYLYHMFFESTFEMRLSMWFYCKRFLLTRFLKHT